RGGGGRGGGAGGGCGGRSCGKPAGVVGMSPRATTRPSAASITNTLRLLCTSSPTSASIGLPSSLRLGRNATPWSAVDLTAAEGGPPSSLRDGGFGNRRKNPVRGPYLPARPFDPAGMPDRLGRGDNDPFARTLNAAIVPLPEFNVYRNRPFRLRAVSIGPLPAPVTAVRPSLSSSAILPSNATW